MKISKEEHELPQQQCSIILQSRPLAAPPLCVPPTVLLQLLAACMALELRAALPLPQRKAAKGGPADLEGAAEDGGHIALEVQQRLKPLTEVRECLFQVLQPARQPPTQLPLKVPQSHGVCMGTQWACTDTQPTTQLGSAGTAPWGLAHRVGPKSKP